MREYTAQEMKDNPIIGWFWARGKEDKTYMCGPIGIRSFIYGHKCVSTSPDYKVPLEDVSEDIIFYGPIERPEVPK